MTKTEIKKHLKRGDINKIATAAKVSRVTVHSVLNSDKNREDVLRIAATVAAKNIEETDRVMQELNAD